MALTQVRAKIGEDWLTLTLNEATGRYEAQTTAQGTSVHQPGGYWPGEAEATNAGGETATATAANMSGLRFVVREETAPTLILISPAPGYLQTNAPVFVWEATDEAGGSGVDSDSFSLDGATAVAIEGGYRFTWTAAWPDGPHTVTASVSDYDGNETTISGAYLVDTVPPELYLTKPYQRHVTDAESVFVAGVVSDVTSGIKAVTVGGEAVWPPAGGVGETILSQAAPASSFAKGVLPAAAGTESFSAVVPLAVGENTIPVVVTDGAGNQTTGSVYMIRLITDRTQADADYLQTLIAKAWDDFTDGEKAYWDGVVRGGYNDEDYNRVGKAVEVLTAELVRRGYAPGTSPKTDWTEGDAPTEDDLDTYLGNVTKIRAAQPIDAPPVPPDWEDPTVEEANDIEKILVETDKLFPHYFAWTAGELTAGGY